MLLSTLLQVIKVCVSDVIHIRIHIHVQVYNIITDNLASQTGQLTSD